MKNWLVKTASKLILLSCGTFTISAAQAESAEAFLSACRPVANAEINGNYALVPETFNAGKCLGAFEVIQDMVLHITANRKRIYGACPPANGTRTQLIAVFVSYADSHPEKLHEEFTRVAFESIQLSFPCK